MKNYYQLIKTAYEQRSNTSKMLIMFLVWVVIYLFFSYTFFKSINAQRDSIIATTEKKHQEFDTLTKKMAEFQAMKQSAVFKTWEGQRKSLAVIKKAFRGALSSRQPDDWEEVMKVFLAPFPGINIISYQVGKERLLANFNTNEFKANIYGQEYLVNFSGNYFAVLSYLDTLEKRLPIVHWESLFYKVSGYPNAKISLLFGIYYDKSN